MQTGFETVPHVLDTAVLLEFTRRLQILDAILRNGRGHLVEDQSVEALALILLLDADQQQVERVVVPDRVEDVIPSEGEQLSVAFLHGFRQRRHGDTEGVYENPSTPVIHHNH